MPNSSAVSSGDDILASQYNDLRNDVLDSDSGHVHDGTDGVRLAYAIKKASDETVTNSTTLQNDDDFVFAMGANEIWVGRIFLKVSTDSTNGIKLAWSLPSGASFDAIGIQYDVSTSTINLIEHLDQFGGGDTFFDGGGNLTLDRIIVEFLITNGANAGNAQLQWAQDSAGASESTTVDAESYLTAWRA